MKSKNHQRPRKMPKEAMIEEAPVRKKHKVYSKDIEPEALDQFFSAMRQDYTVQGALMPDAHTGYSLPIGGVVATKDVILPAWVGYDIGCGMCAYQFPYSIDRINEYATSIYQRIYQEIPTGFNHHQKPERWAHHLDMTPVLRTIFDKKGLAQMGTLGSGNHFIEIGKDKDGFAWIIVHSGSRGVGHDIATHYMSLASKDGKAREGHFGFKAKSENGQNYITDMSFCLAYALENRKRMLEKTFEIIQRIVSGNKEKINYDNLINRNHNHAEYYEGMWIHRKGATQAHKGMKGVVPGNMRDGSFIVVGLGNPDSLWSSSHGAGRIMSRKKAKQKLSLDDFRLTMAGVKAKITPSTIDESPFAYKDIFKVMEGQRGMVKVLNHIKPIINIKA